jgi:arsenite methyltransferase
MHARRLGMNDEIRELVRERYAGAAAAVQEGHEAEAGVATEEEEYECGSSALEPGLGERLYDALQRAELPDEAVLASLGCGNPTAIAELAKGETVLDLGSGGGIDVLLSAKRVGPKGKVYGVDMTDEMLDLARANAKKARARNVEFLKGLIEDVPLPDESVDVVISNCVLNLSTDKPATVHEMFRVLRPGGRIGLSDVVAEDRLSLGDRAVRGSYVGCIAGALSFAEYRQELSAAGFVGISIMPTYELVDGMHGSIVRATKPAEPAM